MRECPKCKKCYFDEVIICPADSEKTFFSIPGKPIVSERYILERRLGQGGMGVVYLARHSYLKTLHAIKVILPDLVGNDPQLVTRFHQEARAAAAIKHPNVIQVSDFGVIDEKMPFLIMEYIEGESLQELLAREKRLPTLKAIELILGICAGVNAAHKQGIVHRDLKPLNIMIAKDKTNLTEAVKILDFGLAKIKSGELLGSFIQAQTTGLMGSPYYMAPEQWSDEEPNPQTDIYSLGIILFQMITGDVPFKASSIPAIMNKHLQSPPPPISSTGVTVPERLEKVILRALEKNRENRTKSVEEFVAELKAAVGYVATTSSFPIITEQSSLHLISNIPNAEVFVDDKLIGKTFHDGQLLISGLQSGKHKIRVSHHGFQDWEEELICDGSTKITVELKESLKPIEKPSMPLITGETPPTQLVQPFEKEKQTPSSKLTTIKIAGILVSLLLILVISFLVFYLKKDNSSTQTLSEENVVQKTTVEAIRPEMIFIPGGTFKMGRNDGDVREKPEFRVTVKDFWLEKTEVTNKEYEQFIKETNHPAPPHWISGKPPVGEEMLPVVYVNMDDIQAFIKWRSKRDGVNYRLPTEEEWEYAARNGSENNLYPWGDRWEQNKAVVETNKPRPVGSMPEGANKWGVLDLIGNVWEWTSSKIKPYPGSPAVFDKPNAFVIRGGCFISKSSGNRAITSTTRGDVEATRKDGLLGFRLARD
ncbi:MAG: SUMF1/EgtB/PvdO family nonheme iron enzyme [Pyrinomonadaceae bacterium]|nr:SUMF1/EgtB/PvdO family nonheme iron enzyme [Pyrinomonadaceae bacterium]MCX7640055.1 SUMF1/EgtB/PvdO family nonheme iron enzyme [Pyrinomonadaceae bacterium]MDW8304227.1 SUMF1/EgtB/PvdO family nonheme iron enzyme [Acidobacteriota bacterium]